MLLSVLDYAMVDSGRTSQEALRETVALAQLADKLGYHRFWVAEHHQVPALASASPELMIMHLLGKTQRIMIGSGGIMLPHYQPYKVAEWVTTLRSLYPGRVNVGLGNNPGTSSVRELMGTGELKRSDYAQQVTDLVQYLADPDAVGLHSAGPSQEALWLLSAGLQSAQLAGSLGQAYVYGYFLAPGKDPLASARDALTTYRAACQEAGHRPQASLAVFVVLGQDETQCQQLLSALDIWQLGKQDYAEFKTFPTVQEASAYPLSQEDRVQIEINRQRVVVGTLDQVKQQLDDLAASLDLEELMVIPLVPDIKNRQVALQALAQAYQLNQDKNLWVEKEGDIYTLSMTPELQDDVGTVGYVEFTRESQVEAGDSLLSLEASKTVLDIFSPLSGRIVDVNTAAQDQPTLLNSANPAESWLVRLTDVEEAAFLALPDPLD